MDKKINRRQFLGGMGAGILSLALSGCKIGGSSDSINGDTKPETTPGITPTVTPEITPVSNDLLLNKLIVSEGTDPETLIENGLQAIGGIEKLVKSGNTVVIKPNFSVPNRGGTTTNPDLVGAVVKQCIKAGAKEVKVIDFPFSSPACLPKSGIDAAAEAAGGKAFIISKEEDFEEVDMGGTILKKVLYSKDVLEADVYINMPILKHHKLTLATMSLKNQMGLIFDRGYFHSNNLDKCIAELGKYSKPDLIIMDALEGITSGGPMGPGETKKWNQVIFGTDSLAVDAYGAKLFGLVPEDITHLLESSKIGVGEIDLNKITIQNV